MPDDDRAHGSVTVKVIEWSPGERDTPDLILTSTVCHKKKKQYVLKIERSIIFPDVQTIELRYIYDFYT